MNKKSISIALYQIVLLIICIDYSYGFEFSFIEPVSDVYTPLNCSLKNTCAGSEDNLHVGVDYMARPTSSNTSTIARSVNFGKLVRDIDYNQNVGCGSLSCNMGNIVIVEHLFNNGEKWLSLHAHLASKNLDGIEIDDYIAKEQYVGIIGCSGSTLEEWCTNGSNRHNHFEVKKPDLGTMDLWPYGYMNQSEANQLKDVGETGDLDIETAIDRAFKSISSLQDQDVKVLTANLSRSTSTPTDNNYDVYGVSNKSIYGYLNINGTGLEEVGILVRKSLSRSDASNPDTSADHKWLAEENSEPTVTGLFGTYSGYSEGDYLFVPYADNLNEEGRYGYPVKFSFVQEGDVIVDNDQLNNGLYQFEGDEGFPVPGYFLTAGLHGGRSDDWARWKPGASGVYRLYVHIPEYGATATDAVFKIKADGQNAVYANGINMADHPGQWVQLQNGVLETFDFTAEGYVGIALGSDPSSSNYHIDENQKVAFDAVKFEKVENSTAGILLFLPAILAKSNSTNLQEGLVAHYEFEGNANDSSGNGNNGTESGNVKYVDGVIGKATQIGDCNNSGHIKVPNSDSLKFQNVFTVAYYVRLDSNAGMNGNGTCANYLSGRTVFAKDHDRSGYFNRISINNNTGAFSSLFENNRYSSPTIKASTQKEGTFELNEWVHVALVINENEIIGYINGSETNRFNDLTIDLTTGDSKDLYIGKYRNSWYPLGGSIDDFRMYNRALSHSEIQQLFSL